MFLSNPAKSFLISVSILMLTGCGFVGTGDNAAGPTVDEPKSSIPFKTREPENFQCEMIEKAGETVRRKRLAKMGTWRRVDLDPGEIGHRIVLQVDREYVIDVGRGIYAESASGAGGQFSELTHELLNTFHRAEFEETARDGNLVLYRVRPADSDAAETVVHYDETVGMPVKQEFFSIAGGERTLQYTIELANFHTEPDAGLFTLPAGLRKVTLIELTGAPRK
jgi:hypothetical protein